MQKKKKKKKREKRSYYDIGYSYLVTHPGIIPAEKGLTLLRERDAVLSLWYYDSTLDNFFFSYQKVTKVTLFTIDPFSKLKGS